MKHIALAFIFFFAINSALGHDGEELNDDEKSNIFKFALNCVESPENCDCTSLDEGAEFCGEQIDKAKECMNNFNKCEGLEDDYILPGNMPDFMKKFFGTTMKSAIKQKKESYAKKIAGQQAKICIETPENCDCDSVPVYAGEFCENKKNLSIQCMNENNITACNILDADETILPPNFPEGIRKIIEPIIRPMVNAKKETVKQLALSNTVGIVTSCFAKNFENCECEKIPHVTGRIFCAERMELGRQCVNGDIDVCKEVDSMPMIPEDIPSFVRKPLEPLIKKLVEQKKKEIYSKSGVPQECMDVPVAMLDACLKSAG